MIKCNWLQVFIPATCPVGMWRCVIETSTREAQSSRMQYRCPEDIYIVFNPFSRSEHLCFFILVVKHWLATVIENHAFIFQMMLFGWRMIHRGLSTWWVTTERYTLEDIAMLEVVLGSTDSSMILSYPQPVSYLKCQDSLIQSEAIQWKWLVLLRPWYVNKYKSW